MPDTKKKYKILNKKRFFLLVVYISIVLISTITGVFLVRNYIIKQAENRIQDVLQEAEALHYYVQREMHPIMYLLKEEGRMPEEFYSPEILSSSFITRRVFNQYNRIRNKNKQIKVDYRLAAKNPRNKINQADSLEIALTDLFNSDSTIQKQSGIIDIDGKKHFYYSRPFLRVKKACLRCHGKKEDAPKALRDYYHWEGGYNLKVGDITAIEVIKTPLKAEFNTILEVGLVILLISVLLIVLLVLQSNLSKRNSIINEQKNNIEANLKKLKETQNILVQSEKMASLGVLTAGVSHEINNPLNFINGAYLGLERFFTKQNPELKNDVSVLLKGLETGIERISGIVQGLNHFSRDSENYNEDCNLHVVIDNCLIILKNQYKNKIELNKRYEHEDPIIKGNEGKLHQVFMNIITNSIQSIKEKGSITITTQKDSGSALVIIKDSGSGIEKENLSKIIEPFFTTKEPGEGTGLGLSISYQIIKEHNGKMDIESEINKGTTVKIYFKI